MRVTKTIVNSSEISSFIDLEIPDGVPKEKRDSVKRECGGVIIDGILLAVGKAKSPIAGEDWPPLSSEYKEEKSEDGRGTKANLESSGDMLDALGFTTTDDGIKLAITGDQAPKADGHNNFSGKSRLPRRKFLPEEGDSFISQIENDVQSIISEAVVTGDNVTKNRIKQVSTKVELNNLLRELYPSITVREAKSAILLDDKLRALFFPILWLF